MLWCLSVQHWDKSRHLPSIFVVIVTSLCTCSSLLVFHTAHILLCHVGCVFICVIWLGFGNFLKAVLAVCGYSLATLNTCSRSYWSADFLRMTSGMQNRSVELWQGLWVSSCAERCISSQGTCAFLCFKEWVLAFLDAIKIVILCPSSHYLEFWDVFFARSCLGLWCLYIEFHNHTPAVYLLLLCQHNFSSAGFSGTVGSDLQLSLLV